VQACEKLLRRPVVNIDDLGIWANSLDSVANRHA
jgi:hypothetical protein